MKDNIISLLDEAARLYHEAYPNGQRTDSFDAHMATVKMVVELAAEEAEKEAAS